MQQVEKDQGNFNRALGTPSSDFREWDTGDTDFVCRYDLELNWDTGRHLEEHKIALFLTETSDLFLLWEFCSQVYYGVARINTRCESIENEQCQSWQWSQTGKDEQTQLNLRPRENEMCRATEGLK